MNHNTRTITMEEMLTLKLLTSMNLALNSLTTSSVRLNTSAAQYTEIRMDETPIIGSPTFRIRLYIQILFIGFSSI